MAVGGAVEFWISRSPLSAMRLNLGTFGGWQTLVTKRTFKPRTIAFSFRVQSMGYVDALFSYGDEGLRAVRLSREPAFPSSVLFVDSAGKYLRRSPIGWPGADGWHRAEIQSTKTGLRLTIDGNFVAEFPGMDLGTGQVGFRSGGEAPVAVDDLEVVERDGSLYREPFFDGSTIRPAFSRHARFAFLLWLAVAGLLLLGVSRYAVERSVRALSVLSVFFLALDFFHISRIDYRPYEMAQFGTVEAGLGDLALQWIERGMRQWESAVQKDSFKFGLLFRPPYARVRYWYGLVSCRADCSYDREAAQPITSEAKFRLMYLGGSRTLGSGGNSFETTEFVQVHSALRKALAARGELQSINWTVARDLELSQDRVVAAVKQFQPSVLVIDYPKFRGEPLRGIAWKETVRKVSPRTRVVMLIPVYNGSGARQIPGEDAEFRKLGREAGIEVIDLANLLLDPKVFASGDLWCDAFHNTQHGQNIISAWIAPRLLTLFP